jgi:hypothetical protein
MTYSTNPQIRHKSEDVGDGKHTLGHHTTVKSDSPQTYSRPFFKLLAITAYADLLPTSPHPLPIPPLILTLSLPLFPLRVWPHKKKAPPPPPSIKPPQQPLTLSPLTNLQSSQQARTQSQNQNQNPCAPVRATSIRFGPTDQPRTRAGM